MAQTNTYRTGTGGTTAVPVHVRIYRKVSSPLMRILISVAFMLLLVGIVVLFHIPNPNMILIAGLVVSAALLGWSGGVSAALTMICYTMYFFSTNHTWLTFSPENLQKVGVSLVGIVVVTGFVCTLEASQRQAFKQLMDLTSLLKEDNQLLAEASSIDALTGAQNRFSLRRDYDRLASMGEPLLVAMFDVDDFKQVNDTYGHEVGDHILSNFGGMLLEKFGHEHVYRYGGDEFLVVMPNKTSESFERDVQLVEDEMAQLKLNDTPLATNISAGYVVGKPVLSGDLRMMLRQADKRLYASKHAGKHRVTGAAFVR